MIKEVGVIPFYNMIEYLLKRYPMFGIEGLSGLKIFIEGYSFAVDTNNISDQDLIHFSKFDEFVNKKFNQMTTEGWVSIIEKNCKKEQKSIELFAELLNEFKNKKD